MGKNPFKPLFVHILTALKHLLSKSNPLKRNCYISSMFIKVIIGIGLIEGACHCLSSSPCGDRALLPHGTTLTRLYPTAVDDPPGTDSYHVQSPTYNLYLLFNTEVWPVACEINLYRMKTYSIIVYFTLLIIVLINNQWVQWVRSWLLGWTIEHTLKISPSEANKPANIPTARYTVSQHRVVQDLCR